MDGNIVTHRSGSFLRIILSTVNLRITITYVFEVDDVKGLLCNALFEMDVRAVHN